MNTQLNRRAVKFSSGCCVTNDQSEECEPVGWTGRAAASVWRSERLMNCTEWTENWRRRSCESRNLNSCSCFLQIWAQRTKTRPTMIWTASTRRASMKRSPDWRFSPWPTPRYEHVWHGWEGGVTCIMCHSQVICEGVKEESTPNLPQQTFTAASGVHIFSL